MTSLLSQTITSVVPYTCSINLALKSRSAAQVVLQPSGKRESWSGLEERYYGCRCSFFFSEYITASDLWGHLEQTKAVMGEKTEDGPQNLLMNRHTQQIFIQMTNWFTQATSQSSHCYTRCTHERTTKTLPSAHTSTWHVWLKTIDMMGGFTKTEMTSGGCGRRRRNTHAETKQYYVV